MKITKKMKQALTKAGFALRPMSVYEKRRERLAKFLEGPLVKAEERTRGRLLIQGWFYSLSPSTLAKQGNMMRLPKGKVNSCGTSGCALGWAATLWPEALYLDQGTVMGRGDLAVYDDAIMLGARFFGVNREVARDLFGGRRATPTQKAAELRAAEDAA